jgi:DNA replication protein DnaC
MTMDPRLLHGRRKLDTDDYRMMDLPNSLWGARFADVPPHASAAVQRYLLRICDLVGTGQGLLLSGPRDSGKALTAAVIAKEAVRRGFTTYWTRVSDLRRDLRAKRILPINDGTFVLDRCYEVGLLVLEDLRAEDAKDYTLSPRDIEDLITGRAARHRATFVTTRLTDPQMVKVFPDFFAATRRMLTRLILGDASGPAPLPEVPPADLPSDRPSTPEPPGAATMRLIDEFED